MAKRIIDKPHNGGTWTDARKKGFIVSTLRRASGRWGPKYTCIKESKIGRNQYVCSDCKKVVGHKMIRADHIKPVVPVSGFTTWDSFIERLFVEKQGYAAVCKECHSIKTKAENVERKNYDKNQEALMEAGRQLEMNYTEMNQQIETR